MPLGLKRHHVFENNGDKSFHTQIYANDSIIFETDALPRLVIQTFVLRLIRSVRFDSSRKPTSRCLDNGATWVNMTGTHYQGKVHSSHLRVGSTSFHTRRPSSHHIAGPTVVITITVLLHSRAGGRKTFDLSSYLGAYDATNTQNGFANCKIRFVMTNKTGTPSPNSLAGWFVDNIMVEGAPVSLATNIGLGRYQPTSKT